MKINDIYESTTAGAIATVAAPMTTQSRNASIYGGKKGGNLLTGKKTKAKYANSKVNESFDTKQKVIDYFVKKGKTAAQGASAWERGWRGPKSKTSNTPVANKPRVDHMAKYDLDEAKLEEAVNHEKKIETLTNQVKALQNRLEVARERRRMQAQRGRGAGRIQSDAETKISSKIAKLRDEIETHRQALKNLNETHLEEGRAGLQQKMTPMQALLGAYGLLISFGTQYLDEKGETPEAQKQLLALVQRLQKDKTLIGLDNKKIEANRDAILKHIHQMMTYAIPILQKYLPADHFAAKRSQINGVLTAYNTARQVNEAHLEEDDVIIVPGQGHRLKSGFIPHDQDRTDHEVEMAKSDLFQAAKNAKQVYELIHDVTEDEGLEGWVQEKIIKANDYLNTVREYLEHKMLQNETGGVIAAGGVGEGLAESEVERRMVNVTKKYLERFGKTYRGTKGLPGIWQLLRTGTYIEERLGTVNHIAAREKALSNLEKDPRYYEPYLGHKTVDQLKAVRAELHPEEVEEGKGLWANIHAKRERIKHGSGERMRKPGSKGAPSAQDFKDAAKEGVGEKIKGVIRREKAKDLPVLQTRRDYAMGKAGDAYNKGETRKGNQYSAYAERDRKKNNDPTTNPAGTYRTKTSDYTNEAQSMGTALKNTLAKAEPGSKLDNSIKAHNRDVKNGGKGTLKNAPTGYHFDSKGYCRLGDK